MAVAPISAAEDYEKTKKDRFVTLQRSELECGVYVDRLCVFFDGHCLRKRMLLCVFAGKSSCNGCYLK